MESEPEVTLPYEKARRLPNGGTVLTIRIKDLPLIMETLERPTFDDNQDSFSIRWVPRESMSDREWEKSVEAMEQHPVWDAGLGGWDVAKGTESKATKQHS
jgi:hypothetical protein